MQVKELMTAEVELIDPEDSLQAAAQMMADLDTGVLPVGEEGRVVGMITDRDISIRAVAKGSKPDTTKVREVMSTEVHCCSQEDTVEDVSRKMSQWQVRRLPVVDGDAHVVGIVSLGDLVVGDADEPAAQALHKISES